jgi:hypothetical protein
VGYTARGRCPPHRERLVKHTGREAETYRKAIRKGIQAGLDDENPVSVRLFVKIRCQFVFSEQKSGVSSSFRARMMN